MVTFSPEMASIFDDLNAHLHSGEEFDGFQARDIIIAREDCDDSDDEIN